MAPDSELVLDNTAIADALINLPGWELKGKQIAKLFAFKNFADALEFVNSVAAAAEKMNHHPDIHLSHTKVKVLSITHKFNAVTKLDIRIAAEIDRIFENR